MELLGQDFFNRGALIVARELVGCLLVHGPVSVRVTETEAYCWPGDSANHCFKGRTLRNQAMFGPPGRAYVYLCYGMHEMLNLVTGAEGEGAAVLIRAAEPVDGLETILSRRRFSSLRPALLAGPGRVSAALGVDRGFNHHPVYEAGGLEARVGRPPTRLARGPRVGIGYASGQDQVAPWRFADADSVWVSLRSGLVVEESP